MTDFESRVRRLLNEDVDHRLGAERPAPPLQATKPRARRPTTRRRSKWLPPLLVAACIALLAAGTAAATQMLSSPAPVGPATGGPAPSSAVVPPSPTSTPSVSSLVPTRSAATSPSHVRVSHASSHATRTTPSPMPLTSVPVSASLIVLPAGWEVRDMQQYMPHGSTSTFDQCLTPKRLPVSTAEDACPVMLAGPIEKTSDLAPDTEGGFVGDPHPCGQFEKSVSTTSGHRQFGGRRATWHHWIHRCEKRSNVLIEQYVVTSAPGYVLYSDQATPEIVAAMATIAGKSQLAT